MIKRNLQTIILFLTTVLMVSLASCNPSKKYEEEESAKIQEYLNNNPNLNFILQPSGLYYSEVLAGEGVIPVTNDTAHVKYSGKFLNGNVFDTNIGKPDSLLIFPVNVGWPIAGFDEGITLMKEGGKAMFLIPSKLAYGATGYSIINGYTPLLYDVELVHVTPGPGK